MKKKISKNNFLGEGIHSVVYFADNIHVIRDWYSKLLGIRPYRDERNFVGFDLGNLLLCFHPKDKKSKVVAGNTVCYWNVQSIRVTAKHFITNGSSWHRRPIHISEGGDVCQLKDPFGNIIGLHEK